MDAQPQVISPTFHPPLGIMGGSVHSYVRGKSPWHADAFAKELKSAAPVTGERKEGWFAQDWCGNDIGFFPDGMFWPPQS
jgi:hypothetical protein